MKHILAFLLLCFTVLGGSSADEPAEVRAFVGLDVVLPCKQFLREGTEVPTVEWSKADLKPSTYVFVYRQNFEVYYEKHPDYEFRTHLFMDQVQFGNFSMRLSNVRKEDAGIYICKTIWDRNRHNVITLKLVVDDVPEPALSVVLSEDGGVTLSCGVNVCLLEPRLRFWDERGNALEADKPQRSPGNSAGCFTVTQRVTAPTSAKSVSCRVEFTEINQSRDTQLLIPAVVKENKESCTWPMVYAGVGTGFIFLVVLGVVLVIKKCCGSAKDKVVRQPSNGSSTASEAQHLLKQDEPDNSKSAIVEIPEISETQNTLTQEPDLISSTSGSVTHKTDRKAGSLFELFPEANANANGINDELATCEITEPSKPVKFKNKTLTRQDAKIDCTSLQESLTDLPSSGLANGPDPAPTRTNGIIRSQSLQNPQPFFDSKTFRRRYSDSVFSRSQKFEQLQEEPEQSSP